MSYSRASAIARLPHIFGRTLVTDEILERVLEQAQGLIAGERSAVLLADDEGRLQCRGARGFKPCQWEHDPFHYARQVVGEAVAAQRASLTSDAQVDQKPDLARKMGIQSIICAPLVAGSRAMGALYVDRRLTSEIFTADDLDMLETIAMHGAIALENAERYRAAREQGRQEGAARLAESMVMDLLPREISVVPGFDVAARWQSAGELSADFYDIYPIPDRERWGLVVADVSDRGPPAAIFMALARSILRGATTAASGPATGIQQANRLICADAAPGRYIRTFYGELDRYGQLHYVNSAHMPPLWWQAARGELAALQAESVALGVAELVQPLERHITLRRDDVLLICSDGVAEARSPAGEPFGMGRLQELLRTHAAQEAPAIVGAILEEAQLWLHGQRPQDDLLLVVVKCLEANPAP